VRAEAVGRDRCRLDQPVMGGTIDATMAKNVRADNTAGTSGKSGRDHRIVGGGTGPP
jgi:hypothetical protein